MNEKQLITTNNTSKILLNKTRNLLDVTNNIITNANVNISTINFKFIPYLINDNYSDFSLPSEFILSNGKENLISCNNGICSIWETDTGKLLDFFSDI
jgi:hypothetical protein